MPPFEEEEESEEERAFQDKISRGRIDCHGRDLDYIEEASFEQAMEDASGFLCWDSPNSPGPDENLKEWLQFFCKTNHCVQFPNLIGAFMGVTEHRVVYCSVLTVGIIAKDSMCGVDEALEDFSYNYQGLQAEGSPLFVVGRSVNDLPSNLEYFGGGE